MFFCESIKNTKYKYCVTGKFAPIFRLNFSEIHFAEIKFNREQIMFDITRNQFVGNHTRVRIPLSPPNRPQFSRIAVLKYNSE